MSHTNRPRSSPRRHPRSRNRVSIAEERLLRKECGPPGPEMAATLAQPTNRQKVRSRDRRHALPTSSLDSFPAPIDTQARSLHAYVHTNAASRSERRPFKTALSRRTDSTPFISTDSLWSGPRLSANRFGRRAKQPARLLVIDAHRLEPGYRFVR